MKHDMLAVRTTVFRRFHRIHGVDAQPAETRFDRDPFIPALQLQSTVVDQCPGSGSTRRMKRPDIDMRQGDRARLAVRIQSDSLGTDKIKSVSAEAVCNSVVAPATRKIQIKHDHKIKVRYSLDQFRPIPVSAFRQPCRTISTACL